MTNPRTLLCCASLALSAVSSSAFAPSANPLRCQISLSADPNNGDDMTRFSPTANSRRSFLSKLATVAAAATIFQSPLAALAEDAPESTAPKIKPLPTYIYNILRVREATEQETRLISTGKFKDLQRANVKLAVKFIINNYKLSDSIIAASSYLKGNARVQASGVGQSAVQSLYTIVEYFDSSDVENIKVDKLDAGKEAIVNNGFKSVRRDIDEFLSMFPQDVVDEAKAKIREENELNYKEFDPSLGSILNPNPSPK
mmetsp:Transcript_41806/g.75283  ORF Transcript_41806/g.75283 Transcript_41806/m.75283 type:complete len:257 (-) Transcript_41806:59-829(-)|eukprot:CAMPEP_0201895518 /NCGR_PEP_ID=MMETSP0902-20130614/42832_1 /ASSEMBLY_ACC=CAM_ASM_000551 /TAXON_ID=420261 /ORGANISM="Thalassiosira antarctica, Strain CCMP982" /LENGTH=256 /DNA_ID=CAMNT_0048427865 /DNA_START=143 /DNA_END=913 /DNA_ORIENTATION=-